MQNHKPCAGISLPGIASFRVAGEPRQCLRHALPLPEGQLTTAAKLKKYWGYLANNVVFIQISTDVSSALKIFGDHPTNAASAEPDGLAENLLFTQGQAKPSSLRPGRGGRKIAKPLERRREKPLRFLRYFLMANYVIKNEARRCGGARRTGSYDWFIAKDNAALCDYAASLSSSCGR